MLSLSLVPKGLRPEDSIEVYHREAQVHKPWLCWCGLHEDNAIFGVRISDVLPEVMEVTSIVATREKNLLALITLQEMAEHLCRSVSISEIAWGFKQLDTHFSS